MDDRYKAIATYVVDRFAEHLGSRLKSAFVKGSVARGDAVWGVSDLDLVLVFDIPTRADTALKREIEATVSQLAGGKALVIQRIAEDRLQQMNAAVRAYWLYSSRYDVRVLFGAEPSSILPPPPKGKELVDLIAPIIREGGEGAEDSKPFTREQTRNLAKRILSALALPAVAEGREEYVAPLKVSELLLPPKVKVYVPMVTDLYLKAPPISNPEGLLSAWRDTWDYLAEHDIGVRKSS